MAQSNGVLVGAAMLAGLGGWYIDERRSRRKRKPQENLLDLLFQHDGHDDSPVDDDDCSASATWTDGFLDQLEEEDSLPWWQAGNEDQEDFAPAFGEQIGTAQGLPSGRAATVCPVPSAKPPRLPRQLVAEPVALVRNTAPSDNADRSRKGWGRWWLAACLLLACVFGARAMYSSMMPVPRDRTLANMGSVSPGSLNIEQIRVGQRVLAQNPDPASSEWTNDPEINPATWRFLRLRADYRWPDGTVDPIDMETLQSPEWIEAVGAQVGAMVPLPIDLVEMGLPEDLSARVLANEPCPPLPPGPGSVVQSTVTHLNPSLYELTLQDEQGNRQTVRPTGLHRIYSGDRESWVRTEDLQEGERVRGLSGWLTVLRRERVPGVHRVYNMTVHGEHVFHVSSLGLLSHNAISCGTGGGAPKKPGPSTNPNAPHNATIRAEADLLEAGGNKILAGGGRLKEKLIRTDGGMKGGRRPDILYETPGGQIRGRNIGRTDANGNPVGRELEALNDLNQHSSVRTDFVPYD